MNQTIHDSVAKTDLLSSIDLDILNGHTLIPR